MFGTGLLQTKGGRWLLSSSHKTDRILQETQMQMNKPAADSRHVPAGGSSPSILCLFFKTSFTICSERGKQHSWVQRCTQRMTQQLKLLSLRWALLCTDTSAVGLLGGRLGLAEAHSGPLGTGEILWEGHVKDLVFQRVAVCRPTQKQTPAAFTSHF